MRAIAPKVYSGQLKTGEWKGAIKGIPKKKMTPELWAALNAGEQIGVDYDTLDALRVAMKKGINPARKTSRLSTLLDHSLNWERQGNLVIPKLHGEEKHASTF